MDVDNDTREGFSTIAEINIKGNEMTYSSPIQIAISDAEAEMETLNETIDTIASLKTKCDKLDYTLAASSGALCGLFDIFLVGTPLNSPLGKITDKWFDERVISFAKLCRWVNAKKIKGIRAKSPRPPKDIVSAIRWLQTTFKIPYDQTSWGDAANYVFDIKLSTDNHHFLSLAHNPSICGLFFSIIDQFTNASHFVAGKEFIELVDSGKGFKLRGNSFIGKLFCGFCNWFGHIMSDISGADGSRIKGNRGMGIPSPLWTWMNDVIVIKSKLGIEPSDFDEKFNQLALDLFNEGYDFRFQTTQAIPVIVNSLIVRFIYAIRRLIRYYQETEKGERNFVDAWKKCRPLNNPEIARMLTVAHGTFCLIDATDAAVRGFVTAPGGFNVIEFFLRLNIIGVGRFTISLGGEVKRYRNAKKASAFAKREKPIIEDYIDGLHILANIYSNDDIAFLIGHISSIENAEKALQATANIAEKRGGEGVRTIEDIARKFKTQ